jgi:hypothetical protein
VWIKEKWLWKEKFLLSLSHQPSFLSEESLPHVIIVVSLGTSELNVHFGKYRGRQIGRLLKHPYVTTVELEVMSGLGVLHLKRSHLGIVDIRLEILCPRQQLQQKPTPAKRTWVPKKLYMEK